MQLWLFRSFNKLVPMKPIYVDQYYVLMNTQNEFLGIIPETNGYCLTLDLSLAIGCYSIPSILKDYENSKEQFPGLVVMTVRTEITRPEDLA